jgi:hypothetical protein
MTNNTCSATEQQARQDRIDEAYAADGRHDPGHPRHGTYTALVVPGPEPTVTIALSDWEDITDWIAGGGDLEHWLDPRLVVDAGEEEVVAHAKRVHTIVFGPD